MMESGIPGSSSFAVILHELAILDNQQNRIDIVGPARLLVELERAAVALVQGEISDGLQSLLNAIAGCAPPC